MQLHDDDLPTGRVLSRREAVRLLAVGSAAVVAGCRPGSGGSSGSTTSAPAASGSAPASGVASTLPRCVAKPELTVGPYFVDKQLNRPDIRIEPTTGVASPGQPLGLSFRVQQITNGQCSPLPNAMVDVWQCDAEGRYSGVNDRMVGFNTEGKKFLRGYQVTDKDGYAHFTTIYPGWYQGRAVHIHFKIRTPLDAALADQQDRTYEFTSQIFFDDDLTDRIHKSQPYAAKGQRDLRNPNDGIYRQGGSSLLVPVALSQVGYAATFDVGLDLSDVATSRAERSGGRGGPPRRPPG
jgi:protocatechuate 3,4-dioxygenase beta subunit